jgi:hypothetical protein
MQAPERERWLLPGDRSTIQVRNAMFEFVLQAFYRVLGGKDQIQINACECARPMGAMPRNAFSERACGEANGAANRDGSVRWGVDFREGSCRRLRIVLTKTGPLISSLHEFCQPIVNIIVDKICLDTLQRHALHCASLWVRMRGNLCAQEPRKWSRVPNVRLIVN